MENLVGQGPPEPRWEPNAYAAVERACDRIDQAEPVIHAFLPEPGRRNRLRIEARSVAARWEEPGERPPLFGVPVGIKDLVRVDGLPTRAGSTLPTAVFKGGQAAVVDRLRGAGVLVAGKTVTAEFAMSEPGPTRNPRDLEHTPGGSSSGSAAAVASGMVPLAVGTQTLGSVIRPAAYCGVVGFKPTFGRVPVDGVVPRAPSFDTVGLFATDVAKATLAAGAVCDDWRQVDTAGHRPVLGIPVGPYLDRAGEEAAHAFDRQSDLLAAAGFTVRRVPAMADFDAVAAHLLAIDGYELARTHAAWFPRYGGLYRAGSAATVRRGQAVGAEQYTEALRERDRLRAGLDAAMAGAGVDLWIAPAATGPAPRGLASTGDATMSLPWSAMGLPALTVPARGGRTHLPLGLQCVAASGRDESLLAWGSVIEQAVAPSGTAVGW